MSSFTQPQIDAIIAAHELWVSSGHVSGAQARLNGMNLDSLDFSGHNLTDAVFQGTSLKNADMTGGNFTNVSFRFSNISSADFTGAIVVGINMSECSGRFVIMPNLALTGFSGAGGHWHHANFSGSTMIGAQVRFSDFTGANLTNVNLTGANLTGCNLKTATVTGWNITNATLRFANMP